MPFSRKLIFCIQTTRQCTIIFLIIPPIKFYLERDSLHNLLKFNQKHLSHFQVYEHACGGLLYLGPQCAHCIRH
jgi:hypothetical protein